MGYHGNRLAKSIIAGKLFILKVLWMCKVSSKSVRSHFPYLRKNPWFSLTTALKINDLFLPVGPIGYFIAMFLLLSNESWAVFAADLCWLVSKKQLLSLKWKQLSIVTACSLFLDFLKTKKINAHRPQSVLKLLIFQCADFC